MYEAEKREIKDEVRKHLKKKKWEMDYWCRFTTSSASLARDVVDQWTLWQLQLDQVSRVLIFLLKIVSCLTPRVPCSCHIKVTHL